MPWEAVGFWNQLRNSCGRLLSSNVSKGLAKLQFSELEECLFHVDEIHVNNVWKKLFYLG